jgi:hypothetical protein
MREAIAPVSLTISAEETYVFRKGDQIGIFPPLVHFDDRFYPNPEEFKYDRFLDVPQSYTVEGEEFPSSACFLPFGGGATYCPGRKFARNEIKAVVAHLLVSVDMCFSDPLAPNTASMDMGRAGLGIFIPKPNDIKLKLARVK